MADEDREQVEDQVRLALAAWCEQPADVERYRRLVEVVDEWVGYLRPVPWSQADTGVDEPRADLPAHGDRSA